MTRTNFWQIDRHALTLFCCHFTVHPYRSCSHLHLDLPVSWIGHHVCLPLRSSSQGLSAPVSTRKTIAIHNSTHRTCYLLPAMQPSGQFSSPRPGPTRPKTKTSNPFLVLRPLVSSLSLIGRGTRGYWAADTTNRSIVFVKDTWRFRALRELEAETLQHLNSLGVRYIPSVVWYGDVHSSLDIAREPDETSCKHEFCCCQRKVPTDVAL